MERAKRNHNDNREAASRKKRKKTKKELDLLRREVLKANKILRDKTAPPKAPSSTFTKVLNQFANRRQANDNKTQGFDSAGRRTGKKKMCNRLLPLRKPQVGIFANGSKGAEIKRANLALTESERARFEGDLQKILNDGKRKSKKSKAEAANKRLPKSWAETVNMNESDFPANQAEGNVSEVKPEPPVVDDEKPNSKRRLHIPIAQDENLRKKPHAETDNEKIIAVQLPFGSDCERKNFADKKWKRSLFHDEDEDSDPIRTPGVEDLRFSPTVIGKAEVKQEPVEPKARPGNQRLNFNCGKLGRMAAAKYQELCAIVSAQNFDNCLKEMPHVDPLKKVRKSLMNFCSDFHRQKELIRKNPTVFPRANIEKSKYFNHKSCLEATENPSTSNFKSNFGHKVEKVELSMIADDFKDVRTDVTNVNRPNDSVSFATSVITEWETSSMRANHGSPKASLKSEVAERSRTNDKIREKILQQFPKDAKKVSKNCIVEKPRTRKSVEEHCNFINEGGRQLIRVPSIGEEMMLRYLKEANNPVSSPPPRTAEDEVPSIFPPEVRPRCYQTTASGVANSLAVNCPDTLRDFERYAGPSTMNLGSASTSTLAQIPSAREKLMLRYLREVNNQDRSIPFTETLADNQERRFFPPTSNDDFLRRKDPVSTSLGLSPRSKRKAVLQYLQDVNNQNEQSAFPRALELGAEKRRLDEAAKRPKLGFQKPVKLDRAADSLAVNCQSGGNSRSAIQNSSPRRPRVPSIRETILLRYLQDVQSGNSEEPEVGRAQNLPGKSERHMPAILRKSQQERVCKKPRVDAEIGKNFVGRTTKRDEPEVVPTPTIVNALFELNERRSRANRDFLKPIVRQTIPRFVYPMENSEANNGVSGQDQDCQRFPVFLKRRSSTSTGNSDELLHIAPRNEPRQVRQFQVLGVGERVEKLHRITEQKMLPRVGTRNISTSLMRPTDIEQPDSGVTFHQAPPPEVLQIPSRSYSQECFERRIDFVVPIHETVEPISSRNAIINPPCRSDAPTENLSRPQNFSPILGDLRKYNCQCLIDPGYPQAGFLRSQIDENGGQRYQRVIHPIYNATDPYRPLQVQLLRNYFPADI